MNVYLPNLRLPNTYQEVEYIQSSWTQYINTGYVPNQNTRLIMNMWWWTSLWNVYTDLFWARLSWGGWRWFLFWCLNSTNFYAMFWTKYNTDITWWFENFSIQDGNNHTIELSQSWIYQDWIKIVTVSSTTFTSPVNLYLFALNDNGTLNELSAFKLYSCKIWNNWALVRDFVPCYRKSDSVIWLYDLVNNQFYTNSWTGTFSKGNDVTMIVLKNAYIGEVLEYDFTQDYHWVTYYGMSTSWKVNYGRDENWLYWICNDMTYNYKQALAWNIPSSIYSKWVPKRITLTLRWGYAWHGWWFSTGVDTKFIRLRWWQTRLYIKFWTQNNSIDTASTPVNTDYTQTIDLENKIYYCSFDSATNTITDSAISDFTSSWSAGNIHLLIMLYWVQYGTAYKWWIKKMVLEY